MVRNSKYHWILKLVRIPFEFIAHMHIIFDTILVYDKWHWQWSDAGSVAREQRARRLVRVGAPAADALGDPQPRRSQLSYRQNSLIKSRISTVLCTRCREQISCSNQFCSVRSISPIWFLLSFLNRSYFVHLLFCSRSIFAFTELACSRQFFALQSFKLNSSP